MKIKKIIFLLLILNIFSLKIFSEGEITREMVIDKAIKYTKKPKNWTVHKRNILDVRKYYVKVIRDSQGKVTDKKIKYIEGQDNIDDRMEYYKYKDKNNVWHEKTIIADTNKDTKITTADITDVNKKHWPYYVGWTGTGEAYAYKVNVDNYMVFEKKIKAEGDYINQKWIAGCRGIDGQTEPLPSGYDGFAGIECSGFVSKAWHFNNHYGTAQLPTYSIEISTAELKPGDVLDRPHKHVIIFNGWKEKMHWDNDGYCKGVFYAIHATPEQYMKKETVRRVVTDEIEIRYKTPDNIEIIESINNKEVPVSNVYNKKLHIWYKWRPYTIFPVFSEAKPNTYTTSTTPTITCKIDGSGTIGIKKIAIIDEVNGNTLPLEYKYTYNKTTHILSYTPEEPLEHGIYKFYVEAKNIKINYNKNRSYI